MNCEQLRKEDVTRILEKILYEFPVSEIELFVPKWVEMLSPRSGLSLIYFIRSSACCSVPTMGAISVSIPARIIWMEGLFDRGESIWETNIFGKSIQQLVEDGIKNKLAMISEESQVKLQDTMQKIVNDSKGGLVCIII